MKRLKLQHLAPCILFYMQLLELEMYNTVCLIIASINIVKPYKQS